MTKIMSEPNLKSWTVCIALGCTLLLAGQVQGQTVYRLVGPDGKVTFSDRHPAPSDKASAMGSGGQALNNGGAELPFELRQVVSKYPVTLYTSNSCAPCGSGRTLLSSRGIPFAEKTINTAEDGDALQRISGDNSLPFLTIGGQQIKGFSDSEWTQFLDAAGYPKTSALPANYRHAAATPLVVLQNPAASAKPEASQSPRMPATTGKPPVNSKSNPAGITF